MKHKFFRALEYAKQLLLLLFFFRPAFLSNFCVPSFGMYGLSWNAATTRATTATIFTGT